MHIPLISIGMSEYAIDKAKELGKKHLEAKDSGTEYFKNPCYNKSSLDDQNQFNQPTEMTYS
jgi:hypothetical protein